MLNFIKKYVEKRRAEKLKIKSELDRLKENFVYRYLLNSYEAQLKGKVDFGAWYYASQDIKRIKLNNKLDEAYTYAKKVMEQQFKKQGEKPC